MVKKSHFEAALDTEINKRQTRLNTIINEKIKLSYELEGLLKSKELLIQSKKRQKENGEKK